MKKTMNRFVMRGAVAAMAAAFLLLPGAASAHCDSFDGPVIKEAQKALQTNKVKLLYKWITPADEAEITALFDKTYALRGGDAEIYAIVEKHFLETLVRLHRASEGVPYTGLKAAGSVKPIVKMSDEALDTGNIDGLLAKLTGHIAKVVREKYAKAEALARQKDLSPAKGREYVRAYVDYVHTIEGIHSWIDGTAHVSAAASGGVCCD